MRDAAHASMCSDKGSHCFLFGPLIEDLADDLPEQVRTVDGDYVQFKLDVPQEPLTVTAVIIEHDVGCLAPRVSGG